MDRIAGVDHQAAANDHADVSWVGSAIGTGVVEENRVAKLFLPPRYRSEGGYLRARGPSDGDVNGSHDVHVEARAVDPAMRAATPEVRGAQPALCGFEDAGGRTDQRSRGWYRHNDHAGLRWRRDSKWLTGNVQHRLEQAHNCYQQYQRDYLCLHLRVAGAVGLWLTADRAVVILNRDRVFLEFIIQSVVVVVLNAIYKRFHNYLWRLL
jgi:hypothetical protein